jgi:hypothetical protein
VIDPAESCPLCDAWSNSDEAHRECLLREAVGGVGHVLDHSLWCVVRSDPDAGLAKRHSARCVALLVDLFGADAVVAADIPSIPLDLVCTLAEVPLPTEGSTTP